MLTTLTSLQFFRQLEYMELKISQDPLFMAPHKPKRCFELLVLQLFQENIQSVERSLCKTKDKFKCVISSSTLCINSVKKKFLLSLEKILAEGYSVEYGINRIRFPFLYF